MAVMMCAVAASTPRADARAPKIVVCSQPLLLLRWRGTALQKLLARLQRPTRSGPVKDYIGDTTAQWQRGSLSTC